MNDGRLEQQSLALSSLMRGEECPNMNLTGWRWPGTKTCAGLVCQAEHFALSVIEFCAAFFTFLSLRPG